MLPTLGEERQQTYSPFLPVSPRSRQGAAGQGGGPRRRQGHHHLCRGRRQSLKPFRSPAATASCNGSPTWACAGRRWAWITRCTARIISPRRRSTTRSARSPAARRPNSFMYELFLDDKGQKISKSKGNGITLDEWLTYGSPESLALFMFQKPRTAKRLYFDVIPKAVDEYIAFLDAYHAAGNQRRTAAGKSGLAHPWRRGAGGALSRQLRAAAQSGQRLERAQSRCAVGLHPRLCAGAVAGDAIRAWSGWWVMRCAITRIS